jgi:hypothetical protein
VVTCDVAREAADEPLAGLRAPGIAAHGSIAMESIDLVLWGSLTDAAGDDARGLRGAAGQRDPDRGRQVVGPESGPLAGIVLAGTLTLLAQKWLWARQRATG